MEKVYGYARVVGRYRIEQEVNKPIFGKPYLTYGQCRAIFGYFLQLGGILGAKYVANLDAFGKAFLGLSGPPGGIKRMFTDLAMEIVKAHIIESKGFMDLVDDNIMKRLDYHGNVESFFIKHIKDKYYPENAETITKQFSTYGAALGAIYPDIIKKMYAKTHSEVAKEEWSKFYVAGLNISPKQGLMSYEETEKLENDAFMDYCRDCCPDLRSVLNKY
jgi:hypothetical protein